MGHAVPAKVWSLHLESLLRAQTKNGSWPYQPNRPQIAGPGYPCGTFMGFANLMLAAENAKQAIAKDPKLAKRVLAARLRGLALLRKQGREFLAGFADDPGANFYTLYALEKACVFAGLERLGDMPWYREGAEALIARQQADVFCHA